MRNNPSLAYLYLYSMHIFEQFNQYGKLELKSVSIPRTGDIFVRKRNGKFRSYYIINSVGCFFFQLSNFGSNFFCQQSKAASLFDTQTHNDIYTSNEYFVYLICLFIY